MYIDIHYTNSAQLFAHVLSGILKCVTWTNTFVVKSEKLSKSYLDRTNRKKTEVQGKKQRNKETWNEKENINWRSDIFAATMIHSAKTVDPLTRLHDVIILKIAIWKTEMSEFLETLFVWNVKRCPSCYEEVNLLFLIMANILLA
jgi:hypothetical protein